MDWMDLVKKNLISIAFGVIALVALVVSFWPVGGWYTELQEQAQKQGEVPQEVNSLLEQPRNLPIIPDTPLATPQPLGRFPNEAVIAQGKARMLQVQRQAAEAENMVVGFSRRNHDVLLPGALPDPIKPPYAFTFRNLYREVMLPNGKPEQVIPNPSPAQTNIISGVLEAVFPPTNEEIIAALVAKWDKEYKELLITVTPPAQPGQPPPQPVESNRPEVEGKFLRDTANFAQQFRRERATQYRMYVDPDPLTLAARPMESATGAAPTAEDMWYAQMGLWVQRDLAMGIADMNRGAGRREPFPKGIQTAPVKHLLRMDVRTGPEMYVTAGPPPGASAPDATMRNYGVSFTGRVCNQMYDVVHSTLVFIADETAVNEFIDVLQAGGRMITVLEVDTTKIDSATAMDMGLDYGTRPVTRVTFLCEHLFMRSWTAHGAASYTPPPPPGVQVAPMPQSVRDMLGVVQRLPPAPPEPAAPADPVAAR